MISYNAIEKHFVLVPVNTNPSAIDILKLKNDPNKTYNPANVYWTVDSALKHLNVVWLEKQNNILALSKRSRYGNYSKVFYSLFGIVRTIRS